MILVFGGTTEGRTVVETLDEGAGKYFYSTRGEHQKLECGHGVHIHGAMTEFDMLQFCRANAIRLIIDAAHPFASSLHSTVDKVGHELSIPVIRFERRYPDIGYEKVVWCYDFEEAINVKHSTAVPGYQQGVDDQAEYYRVHDFRIGKVADGYLRGIRVDIAGC